MKVSHKLANSLLLFFTPVITGLSITASPSLAATLASSTALFRLDNFTHSPQNSLVFISTNTDSFASEGIANPSSNLFAEFFISPYTYAQNQSEAFAEGEGWEYTGMAQNVTAVVGENFLVQANETFSFDFAGILDLYTSIDTPPNEGASADGSISFQLYNSITGNLLDYFAVGGNLVTPESEDFLYSVKSDRVTLNSDGTYFGNYFGGNQEFAFASLQGNYSRTFDSLTYLTLVEIKTNRATVKAPEPSSTFGLILFCLIALGYKFKISTSVGQKTPYKNSIFNS